MQSPKPYREQRPWGEFLEFTKNTPSTVKIITVNPGESLSLQKHASRDEFWHVISGEGVANIGDEIIQLSKGVELFVPRGTVHRIAVSASRDETSSGMIPIQVLEIAFGDFDENDIERIQDNYGRAK